MLRAGGDFLDISSLPGCNTAMKDAVKDFFVRCYGLLSHDTGRGWNGYEFNGNGFISNRSYKEDFCSDYPTRKVCPYCDEDIGTPQFDHYLCKSRFPLLACSPWNLVPVCPSCNDAGTAKGEQPSLTVGPPHSANDWLHPFFRAASTNVRITLSGPPGDPTPELHSPDPAEQLRLNNHISLMDQLNRNNPFRSLSKRWTNTVASFYEQLVGEVNRRNLTAFIDGYVAERLDDYLAVRGRSPSSMARAAVCRAVLDRLPEYMQEFLTPNAPALV
jgi:hypothetical protein